VLALLGHPQEAPGEGSNMEPETSRNRTVLGSAAMVIFFWASVS
jgi:hypothetical protein